MAYTPINWQNGDTITAAKMNKMDNGWSVETTSTTIYNNSVTYSGGSVSLGLTSADLSTTNGNTIIVTWNGTDYSCACYDGYLYGSDGYDWTTYPFSLSYDDRGNKWSLSAETNGTYTLVIGSASTTIEVSDNFATASQNAVANVLPLEVEPDVTTWQEVYDALNSHRMAIYYTGEAINIFLLADASSHSAYSLSIAPSGILVVKYVASSADSAIYGDDSWTFSYPS